MVYTIINNVIKFILTIVISVLLTATTYDLFITPAIRLETILSHMLDEQVVVKDVYLDTKSGKNRVALAMTNGHEMVYIYYKDEFQSPVPGSVYYGTLLNISDNDDSEFFVLWLQSIRENQN